MTVMIAPLRDYETLLMDTLIHPEGRFPLLAGHPTRVGAEVPEDLLARVSASVPFVRTTVRTGRTTRTQVYPILDVDVFSLRRHLSHQLAVEIEAWLTSGRHRWVDAEGNVAIVDEIDCTEGPQRVPWPAADVDRYVASYAISTRRV